MLRLEQGDLAERAHVSVVTIRRLEGKNGAERVGADTLAAVRAALEEAGAEFIPGGVRSGKSAQDIEATYERLRVISLRSAARLQGRDILNDSDLYDEDGLPA